MSARFASMCSVIEKEELKANEAITDLISKINILSARKDNFISSIKSPKLLIRGLTELQSLVEMVDIKHSIVNQIKFLITNITRKETTEKFENHMLHSVISGNPGTGKTTVAMILAKIWMGLGFVNSSAVSEAVDDKITLYEKQMDRLRTLISKNYRVSSDLRRKTLQINSALSYKNPDEINTEWTDLVSIVRDLRFGFDDIMRESKPVTRSNPEKIDPYEHIDPKFVVASREDLIGQYLGHTAPKTKKVLESARGGVLFIDEAYSLCNMDGGSKDKFGEECLTTINEFMSLYPNDIIVIFAGYKDKLLKSIFKAQPGLMRRCSYFFEIKDYTPIGLSKIFTRQLSKDGWVLDPKLDLADIINKSKISIDEGGGFTEKLAFFSKLAYGSEKFDTAIDGEDNTNNSIITESMLLSALDMLEKSSVATKKEDPVPIGMFI